MSPEAIPPLTIRLFGAMEVSPPGTPFPRLRAQPGYWLLALLVLRHDREVDRGWLAGTLWPDSLESTSADNLRKYLVDLRRALGTEAVRLHAPTPRTLRLDLEGVYVDVIAFDAAIARGDTPALEGAVALYRGPLLEACAEAWVLQERENREQALLATLETLAARSMAAGDPAAAERHLRRAVSVDPLRETAHRGLMQALAAGGNYAAAQEAYRELRLLLHREVNAEPDPETQAVYAQIRQDAREKAIGATSLNTQRAAVPPSLPEGTVTLLFTDIEGSTRLVQHLGDAYPATLQQHNALLSDAVIANNGYVVGTKGDSFFVVFSRAQDAVAGVVAAQRALATHAWPAGATVRVRMGLHSGEPILVGNGYVGLDLHRAARIMDAAHGGQVLLSESTRALVAQDLPPEISLHGLGSHRLKDLQQPEPLFQLLVPDLPAEFPPLRSLEARAHNLPLQLTSFIGRERELAEATELLSRDAKQRLVTLTGPGGCGKTRLALQVASELLEDHTDGAWLVRLEDLTDPTLVPQAVATALGVREEPGRAITQTLTSYLERKDTLLVLDNCEQVVAACATLAETLLRSCPGLRILATSREALRVGGETVRRVPSLSLPDPERWLSAGGEPEGNLTQYDAARLFIERALAVDPAFAVTNANAPAVAQICHRLDGIPLAIELAAARVRHLSVVQIMDRLDDRFRLLTGGSRTALPRHQTLRAAVDWSYDLLSEPEQVLLRRLSVFAGGFTLEAVEAICAGEDLDALQVLDLIGQLVDKSLVLSEPQDGGVRYRLLETIRQYGWEHVQRAREDTLLRERHGDLYLELAEQAVAKLTGPAQAEWLSRLEQEHDNLRRVISWCEEQENGDPGLRLGAALEWFWYVRGHLTEGRKHLASLLALSGAQAGSAARATALNGAGNLAFSQGEYEAARSLYEESLAVRRETGDRQGIAGSLGNLGNVAQQRGDHPAARSLHEECLAIQRELSNQQGIAMSLDNLGLVARQQGDFPAARSLHEESLAIKRELGDRRGMALSLNNLGLVARQLGNYPEARSLHEEGLTIVRELGDRWGIAMSLNNLGNVAWEEGDYPVARSLREESLAVFRELGDRSGMAASLNNLGRVVGEQGDYSAARQFHEECLTILFELGDRGGIAESLESLALLGVAQAQMEQVARLLGAAEALRKAIGAPRPTFERTEVDGASAATRTALGEAAFAAAWEEGRRMSLEEAVEYALSAE
jgi:predicted ATPase/class 3 adenylate cyclase/Tfp pilus assembly protein PilF